MQQAPFKAKADVSSLELDIIDAGNPAKVLYSLKDIHPRDIALADSTIALGEALAAVKGDVLTLRVTLTEHHFIDYIGLLSAGQADAVIEELPLIKAVHSNGSDAAKDLAERDKSYVHLVRGDELEMTFAAPGTALKPDQEETYFFAASGFYHGLRTYLYPKVDPSMETFRADLRKYIEELPKQ